MISIYSVLSPCRLTTASQHATRRMVNKGRHAAPSWRLRSRGATAASPPTKLTSTRTRPAAHLRPQQQRLVLAVTSDQNDGRLEMVLHSRHPAQVQGQIDDFVEAPVRRQLFQVGDVLGRNSQALQTVYPASPRHRPSRITHGINARTTGIYQRKNYKA